MAVNLSESRDRVGSMVANLVGPVQLGPGGELSFAYESTRVFVDVRQFGDDSAIVNVYAYTNVDLALTPELYEFVATHGGDWVFGHLAVLESEGKGTLIFRHTLLADYLDEPELTQVVAAIATTADEIDDVIKQRFGGVLASEV